eukprot:CAMPEP_0196661676 /NCGR_PEP_ID=MMETSP1086-20130531/45460_1 /TAXON_ID=77921 /ORGANISM="Cyanoptyche  gloeocystis , Strain SAG4.97" /LENGTH=83 /DNA_ID=CAMNT_0041996685 /DNA_START=192 /DNA_END=442 /DNA_ORIENTATION=+
MAAVSQHSLRLNGKKTFVPRKAAPSPAPTLRKIASAGTPSQLLSRRVAAVSLRVLRGSRRPDSDSELRESAEMQRQADGTRGD